MAKTRMMCPFSGGICKDCPVYRGRHYYLCFCEKYRRCLPEAIKDLPVSKKNSNGKFEMPSLPASKKDPYFNEML
jgi:hypothetical protein